MTKIWALADLHLSFGAPSKTMDIFGPAWQGHAKRVEENWRENIKDEDLVLLPGDIAWAMYLTDAAADFEWIEQLPGTKVMIRGNHDYWWTSANKVRKALPPTLHIIQNDTFLWNGVTIGGTRLWDTPEYGFSDYIVFRDNPKAKGSKKGETKEQTPELQNKIFQRELQRLEISLEKLDPEADLRIAMTHYPPIGADMAPSEASALLEKYKVDICLFGHLHNVPPGKLPFGTARGVRYALTACDYLKCSPLLVTER